MLGLLVSGVGTAASAIQSADANSQANKIAQQQTNQEQTMLTEAQQQQNQQNQKNKNAMDVSAAEAARRALAGNNEGYNSTTGGQNQSTVLTAPGPMVAGRTLLG